MRFSKLDLKSRNGKNQTQVGKIMHKRSASSSSYMKYQSLCSIQRKTGDTAIADHGGELKTKLHLEGNN